MLSDYEKLQHHRNIKIFRSYVIRTINLGKLFIMKKIIYLLILCPYLLATQCFEEECAVQENWEVNSYVPLISVSPIQDSYTAGDILTLRVTVPASNEYYGEPVNFLESTGDESGLLQLISWEGKGDLFQDNTVTFKKGSQGEYSTWFEMPFNAETGNYEFEADITLNRTGAYTMLADGSVEFGSSDCPSFILNMSYSGIDAQSLEFLVAE